MASKPLRSAIHTAFRAAWRASKSLHCV